MLGSPLTKIFNSAPAILAILTLTILFASVYFYVWEYDQNYLDVIEEHQEGFTENKIVYPKGAEQSILDALTKRALKTYPSAKLRFLNKEIQNFQVRTIFTTENGSKENGYVIVKKYMNGKIHAVYRYKEGDDIKEMPMIIPESKILDWLIYHSSGVEEGNLTGKYLLEKSKK